MAEKLRIGTRGSDLALWQARHVAAAIGGAELVIIKTSGDRIQNVGLHEVEGVGFFTKEIERALLDREVDIAVHSYKDLPTAVTPGLRIAAVPQRAPVRDVVVRRAAGAAGKRWALRDGAAVGTSSLRRRAQILSLRPDLDMRDLRGNVPTRFDKVARGELDAVVLAEAGLVRLGLDRAATGRGVVLEPVEVRDCCPAPSQGALAIQIRDDDARAAAAVAVMHDAAVARAVAAERALLGEFGGGCHLPLGVHCMAQGDELQLFALVASPDGAVRIQAEARGQDDAAVVAKAHRQLMDAGAGKYL